MKLLTILILCAYSAIDAAASRLVMRSFRHPSALSLNASSARTYSTDKEMTPEKAYKHVFEAEKHRRRILDLTELNDAQLIAYQIEQLRLQLLDQKQLLQGVENSVKEAKCERDKQQKNRRDWLLVGAAGVLGWYGIHQYSKKEDADSASEQSS